MSRHVLAQQLLQKPRLEDCSVDEIRRLVANHPYFAPARFLLLQKLRAEGSEEATDALQKAVLYYHDPLLFEHFISAERFYTDLTADEALAVQEEPANTHEQRQEKALHPALDTPEIPLSENDADDIPVADVAEEKPESFETAEAILQEPQPEIAPVEQTAEASTIIENTDLHTEVPVQETDTPVEQEPAAAATVNETPEPAPQVRLQETTEALPLTFEPYHAVDYFASQGIRLSQEDAGKDRMGRQLKSFTDWLKTMKRLPAAEAAARLESGEERQVQHLADRSVNEADIVTEAMAEVWIKQGNHARACAVYEKLSLQNPSKRAYFAAKIENLKTS